MFTKTFRSLQRLSEKFSILLLVGGGLCGIAAAQMPATVVSSSLAAFPHTGTYGQIWQGAVSSRGDFVVLDFQNGGLYDFPANGGAVVTIAAPNALFGGYANSGMAIDPRNNNIYVDDNFNNGLLLFPYDPATGLWDLGSSQVATSLGGNLGGSCGNYFQSAGLSINANGLMAIGTENGCGVEIFTVPIDASGNFGNATPVDTNMPARARTLAIDNAGNIYFTEDNGGLKGANYFPAGTTTNADAGAVRVDPNLSNVVGVSVDSLNNIYVADSSAGVFLVPLQGGVPVPANAVQITPATAQANASMDLTHGTLDVPVTSYAGFNDAVKVFVNRLELGAVAVGSSSTTPGSVTYTFSSPTTPANFVIDEGGASPDFAIATGGTCSVGTGYAAQATCTVNINLAPHVAGDVSARLLMLDAQNNLLGITLLHGTGQAPSVQVLAGGTATIATGLVTPSQVATDPLGDTYVADSGAGKVTEYPSASPSSPLTIGTGLKAPTGVAVDGAGDVFIADSGSVFEVPITAIGLNVTAQAVLKSGLGANLTLAVDDVGDVFVSDPSNQRVVMLSNLSTSGVSGGLVETDFTGFTQISAITADGAGDLFVANGQNLVEIPYLGAQTTLLSSLTNASSLALDPSGSIYVTESGGTLRIPNQNGTLNISAATMVDATITNPNSVAVDPAANVHLTDTSGDVVLVSASAAFNFGTLTTTTSNASQSFTVLNNGNTALNISGFLGDADYSETSTTCTGPLPVSASCSVTVTFSPGPGDQGTLATSLLVTGNESNTPVGINLTGVGAPLASSVTAVKVSGPTVNGAPAVVTVSPSSGSTPTPTGSVTLTVTGTTASGTALTPLLLRGTLTSGSVTLTPTNVPAGTYTFAVSYQGDRNFSGSTASTSVTIAAGAVTLMQPTLAQVQQVDTAFPYVLSGSTGSREPTDGSVASLEYTYPVTVVATDGQPLIGVLNPDGKTYNYGSVLYEVNGAVLSTCAPVAVASNGSAPFNTSCLPINTTNTTVPDVMTSYTITPVYTPAGALAADTTNPNYTTFTGTPITFIAISNPLVMITSNPTALSLASGSTATAQLTLTSVLGYGVAGASNLNVNYTLPLELACDGLPAYATCSFSYPTPGANDPTSVNVTPTTPGMVTVTINTNVPTGAVSSQKHATGGVALSTILGLGLLGFSFGRRKLMRTRLITALCLLLSAGIIGGSTGCGTKQLGGSTSTTTPAGTYTVSITAKQVSSIVIPPSTPSGSPTTDYGQENQMSLPFTMSVTVQ